MKKLSGVLGNLWNKSPNQIYTSLVSRARNRSPQPRWVTVLSGPLKGGRLFLDPESFAGWREMLDGVFDDFIYQTLSTVGELKGKVFWDVGAHFGYHSLSFAVLGGSESRVFSFEPNPYNIERLRLNLDHNGILRERITIKECALSQGEGDVEFSFSKNVDDSRSSGSHMISVDAPLTADHYESFETINVRAETIDSLVERNDVESADIIKIDVEGAESLVLAGGLKFFASKRPMVFMEVHNILMMYHCLNYFRDMEYSVRVLDKAGITLSRCFIFAMPKQSYVY